MLVAPILDKSTCESGANLKDAALVAQLTKAYKDSVPRFVIANSDLHFFEFY